MLVLNTLVETELEVPDPEVDSLDELVDCTAVDEPELSLVDVELSVLEVELSELVEVEPSILEVETGV